MPAPATAVRWRPARWANASGKLGFIGGRGIVVELMQGGRSAAAHALARGERRRLRSGGAGTHEGAALALLDTAGAMAAWSVTGPGLFKASTPAIQTQVLAPPPAADLVAFGRVVERDEEMFWSEVEVAEAPACGCARAVWCCIASSFDRRKVNPRSEEGT